VQARRQARHPARRSASQAVPPVAAQQAPVAARPAQEPDVPRAPRAAGCTSTP